MEKFNSGEHHYLYKNAKYRYEKRKQQKQQWVILVGKRGLEGSLVVVGKIVQVKVEYMSVALALPPVEDGEQGQIME